MKNTKEQELLFKRPPIIPDIGAEKRNYDAMPSSPLINFTNHILNAMDPWMGEVRSGKNSEIFVEMSETAEDRRLYQYKSGENTITIQMDKISEFSQGKGLRKFFVFYMIQCNKSGFPPVVRFSLQSMVDAGIYNSIQAARRGVKDSIPKLISMSYQGEVKKGSRLIREVSGVFVYKYVIENNIVSIYRDPDINISFLAQYFTIFPKFAFRLKSNAFSLVEYIFYLARQNINSIKKNGTFTIGIRAVHDRLNLKSERETTKHTQLIIKPILAAIKEIEDGDPLHSISIKPVYDATGGITEFLNGYLEIKLSAEFNNYFCSISASSEKILKQIEEREEKNRQQSELPGR